MLRREMRDKQNCIINEYSGLDRKMVYKIEKKKRPRLASNLKEQLNPAGKLLAVDLPQAVDSEGDIVFVIRVAGLAVIIARPAA